MPAQEADEPTVEASQAPDAARENDRPVSEAWKRFSELPLWEDGLSEMSYYDATCEIYGKPRKYTRVHLMNRQEMDAVHYIKASEHSQQVVPVFKFVIAEEIPTENYNYRFLITAFQERPSLRPLKVSISSQEWCGHTWKYLTWERRNEFQPERWSLDISCYSYFPLEGDRWFPHPSKAYIDAYETLFLYSRAVAAGGEAREMVVLKSMHSNHMPDPEPLDAVLRPEGEPRTVTVPLGTFKAQRVVLDWEGETTWFDIAVDPPYRLLAFKASDVEAKLRFTERRAYWDRDKPSKFHKPGEAP